MAECISEKMVKTRKPHRCHGCMKIFPSKTKMTASVNKDGEIYTLYFCEKCKDFIDNHPEYFEDEEIYAGDLTNFDDYIKD